MTLFDLMPERRDVLRTALLSENGLYRYGLSRTWDRTQPIDLWIMCNPSTADGTEDDPTISRCTRFSRALGSGGYVVANAYAYRATKPAAMWMAAADGVDIVGPANDRHLRDYLSRTTGRVIVAWGAHPKPDRCWQVSELLTASRHLPFCLGTTKDGMPRHPLMLRNDARLEPWEWPVRAG